MDHLKAIEGLLTFHHAEIERLDIARKVILELDRRMEDRIAAKRAGKSGSAAPKKLTFVKKANGHHGPTPDTVREKIIELVAAEPGIESGTIMTRLGTAKNIQAKQRVYSALHQLKKAGKITLADHGYTAA